MGQIVTLDENMVNMIAAGEVIERPANVAKELMENSIDAGATQINISVEDGGRRLISVADNGYGMDADDLALAFEPHATSKVKNSSDLHSISTLGFRGEALASIASVAQVAARSKTKHAESGSCIEVDCGSKGSLRPCSADDGTKIEVRNIFYKLPARRKFLKTANTEMSHITEHFTRIALAKSDLGMSLTHNGRELHRLAGNDNLRQRIARLFSPEVSENLMQTESNERGLHLFALLGRPESSRTSSKFQYVFLNGRFIKDKFISHAIKEAYRGSIEPNRYAVVFLFIQMPCEQVDVNVHPSKIEVRFYNANLVHSQILSCLRQKLLGANLQTTAKLPSVAGSKGFKDRGKIADAMSEFIKSHRPGREEPKFSVRSPGDNFYKTESHKFKTEPVKFTRTETSYAPHQKPYLQIHDSFIVAQNDEGFVIIDQHALHERILYQRLRSRTLTGKLESQRLLIPESFQLSDHQAQVIKDNAALLKKLGIEIVPFGPGTFAVQAFPVLLAKASPTDFVQDLIDLLPVAELTDKTIFEGAGSMPDEVLKMAACKTAVKAGQKLSDNEIEQLLADSKEVEYADHCPHGRPTTIKFTLRELERQFKRT
ncbi:MAG: DNA mismatch repair endonuclease MutL [Sedimentisphaerales bacterium]|nr:DNA mismatch repair endonuclease MutL [Sedimentisphaerales bacterium]